MQSAAEPAMLELMDATDTRQQTEYLLDGPLLEALNGRCELDPSQESYWINLGQNPPFGGERADAAAPMLRS